MKALAKLLELLAYPSKDPKESAVVDRAEFYVWPGHSTSWEWPGRYVLILTATNSAVYARLRCGHKFIDVGKWRPREDVPPVSYLAQLLVLREVKKYPEMMAVYDIRIVTELFDKEYLRTRINQQ